MDRPFQCSQCLNWYTPAPGPDNNYGCRICAQKKHTPHQKTGVIDCHFGQESSTPSEIILTKASLAIRNAAEAVQRAGAEISSALTIEKVIALASEAERMGAEAEKAARAVPDAI